MQYGRHFCSDECENTWLAHPKAQSAIARHDGDAGALLDEMAPPDVCRQCRIRPPRPDQVDPRYFIVDPAMPDAYLGFGGRYATDQASGYPVVEISREHAVWQHSMARSGLFALSPLFDTRDALNAYAADYAADVAHILAKRQETTVNAD